MPVRVAARLAPVLLLALPVAAQTTYTWTGPATNDGWNDGTHWDTDPDIPGSALNPGGALDDEVIIRNQLASGNQNVRLLTDAGTIGTLSIGGSLTTAANTNFQIRTNAANLDVSGNVFIGGFDANGTGTIEKAGQLVFNNGNPTMSIGGDIVSVTGANANRVLIDGGATANLTLAGTIDPGGAKEIDLWINRSNGFTTNAGITMNVDNFRVGTAFNGNRTGRSYTLDGGRTINANTMDIGYSDGNNATNYAVDGTFNLNDANVTLSGNAFIGRSNSATAAGERSGDGTVNVGAGGNLTTAVMNLGGMNDATQNAGSAAIGRLNLTDATSVVNVTTMNIGQNLRGEGIVTVDAGTLTTTGRVYIGGDEVAGEDAGTRGTLNVNAGGTMTVGSGNTEVGRGGAGFFNVDGGTYNQVANNLVVGQSFGGAATAQVATGTVTFTNGAQVTIGTGNNDLNFNKGGGSVTQSGDTTVVSIGRNLNMADEGTTTGGSFSSTYTLNGGTLNVGAGNAEGDVNMANQVGSTAALNVNGGTLNIEDSLLLANNNNAVGGTLTVTGGRVNVGGGGSNRNLVFAAGTNGTTATAVISGGTVAVANNVDFRGGEAVDSLTLSGDATLTVGNNLDLDGGTGANINRLVLEGSNATLTVGGNLLLDNNAELTFALDGSGVTTIDTTGNLTMNTADLVLDFSGSGLSSALTLGDLDLIGVDGTLTGEFSTFAFGDTVETFGDSSFYTLEQGTSGNGVGGVYLMAQIPEPSISILGVVAGAFLLRRRRRA